MELHAKNMAIAAGATGNLVDKVAKKMIEEKNITAARAEDLVRMAKE
jgi:hydroxymethylglutaryl-CoA reductase